MGCGSCRQGVNNITADIIKAPIMNPDGSITFPSKGKVPLIEGYTANPENEFNLIPDNNCVCIHKMTGIMLQRNGIYKPHHVCMCSKCPHKSKAVTTDICKACSFRQEP